MAVEIVTAKEELWLVSFTFPANAPIGTVVNGSVQRYAGAPAENVVIVPISEVEHIMDLYVLSAPTPDILVDVEINAVAQKLNAQMGAFNLALVSRKYFEESIPIGAGEQLAFKASNIVAVGASAVTIVVYAKVLKVPISA